jgi:hypothetical protein
MKKFLLAVAALLALSTPCLAKSQSFQFVATCSGSDEVYSWTINGRAGANGNTGVPVLTSGGPAPFVNWPTPGQAGSSFIYPFTPQDILITGIQILAISGIPNSFYMPGNNYDGDPMVFLPAGQSSIIVFYPPGAEFHFPGYASGNATNMSYVDLHGSCAAGQVANVMYTIFYK